MVELTIDNFTPSVNTTVVQVFERPDTDDEGIFTLQGGRNESFYEVIKSEKYKIGVFVTMSDNRTPTPLDMIKGGSYALLHNEDVSGVFTF